MIKACLFDLDGTLLPMDTYQFVEKYMRLLSSKMSHFLPPEQFTRSLWKATLTMMRNRDHTKTNQEVFEASFVAETGIPWSQIADDVNRFYEQDFPTLRKYVGFQPLARAAVETALEQGYQVAIATNPVFPKVAVLERLRWAGIDDLPFSLVTVYEETYFCKPHLEYYQGIAKQIGISPQECVMIGNDMQEDMVSTKLGMRTFLLQSHRIDRGNPTYPVDQEGELEDLLTALQQKTGPFRPTAK